MRSHSLVLSALLVLVAYPLAIVGHVAMIQPAARQVVNKVGLIQRSYTTFGSFGDVYGNNANVFGGPAGPEQLRLYGYGLCGDDGRRKAFSIPSAFGYAPTAPQMTIEAGKPFEVLTHFTTHHLGWMEFRLCAPEPGEKVVTKDSAACFKQHVLRLDSQQHYSAADMPTGVRSVFDFEGTPEAGYNFHHAKCQQGPPDTCCDADSGCSPVSANVHRFMLPRNGVDNNYFKVRLIAPEGVTCDRCTLQMTYRTGNSPDSFPETFWNCADIAIVPSGTNMTPPPSTRPPSSSTTTTSSPTRAVTPTTSPPTAKTTARPSKMPTARSPSRRPSTRYPTRRTTRYPTRRTTRAPSGKPTTAAPTTQTTTTTTGGNGCGNTWEQCGGLGFTGAKCCKLSTDSCVVGNEHWSMCTPNSNPQQPAGTTKAPSLRPTSSPSTAGCAQTWKQCGGEGFTGNRCCASPNDACVADNQWWSMCRPK